MTNKEREGVPEDLEDGEIGTDEEEAPENPNNINQIKQHNEKLKGESWNENVEPKEKSKKKKSKNSRKFKDKHKKQSLSPKEDFAENVERALRRAVKNDSNDGRDESFNSERFPDDSFKKTKKRKKDHKDKENSKKRRKQSDEEVDESEMMFVRGASPTNHTASPEPSAAHHTETSSDETDSSNNSRHNKEKFRRHKKKKTYTRRREPHPNQDPDGVCLYFMQGQCQDIDCPYSHEAEPPRKYELCKFYLMKCCAKGDNCLYMHSDFPCKFYHTGLPCKSKEECKFAHGAPLNEQLKMILLKHIETAPKEILGDFPRMPREAAIKLMNSTQQRLMQQNNSVPQSAQEPTIPSLFELNVPKPPCIDGEQSHRPQFNKGHSKSRHSRWQNESQNNRLPNLGPTTPPNILSIKNLTGVLSPKQIADLEEFGIQNLSQLSQLTLIQLNQLGLDLKQIHDIQMNTLSIQKLGLINKNSNEQTLHNSNTSELNSAKDLDLRVPPVAPNVPAPLIKSSHGQDVDMRFHNMTQPKKPDVKEKSISQSNKDTIDIDQYRKDALKFLGKEKSDNDSNESANNIVSDKTETESKDVDHRVLHYGVETPAPTTEISAFSSAADVDIRFLAPDPKKIDKADRKQRMSTTDDEDNNLLIDEKWYSSDDENKANNRKSRSDSESPKRKGPTTPPYQPSVEDPKLSLGSFGDLSKINISDEVTKILNTMKSNLQENKDSKESSVKKLEQKPRDPRAALKKSPTHKSPSTDFAKKEMLKSPPLTVKKSSNVSIYSCLEGGKSDGRKRNDVDLRPKTDQDFRLPVLSDTDFRQTPGESDIDFRLALPFKPIANYTPATEINGSINSHPHIPYKLHIVHIPAPDYTGIKNSTAKSQALSDPRLRKVFRLSTEDPISDNEKPTTPKPAVRVDPRADPRRKPKENVEQKESTPVSTSLDLQVVIQNSAWYKDLSTNQKIMVNQQLATINSEIKKYNAEKQPGVPFDLNIVHSNPILTNILGNLGVFLNENGDFSYMKENVALQGRNMPQDMHFNMPPNEGNMMNNMGMPPMRMNMPMPPFNGNYSNTGARNAPGLLGIAPNMPFPDMFGPSNNGNFQNFGPNNFGPFNGPPDFNGMDSRHMGGRGSFHPGRGGDRGWPMRGRGNNRDMRNFNDRGKWRGNMN